MISYAQNFEDVMLFRIFRDKLGGFYIDVGAADPAYLSVTKWFYELGWRGINIEPRSLFFKALQSEWLRDVNLHCGAGDVSGQTVYFLKLIPAMSFDANVQTTAALGNTIIEHTIPILTLNEIIERHGNNRAIDFLKIDVEGWE